MFNAEPTAIIGFIRAVLYLGVLFGFDVSEAQMGGIIVVVESALVLWNRSEVVPVETAKDKIEAAFTADPRLDEMPRV